MKKKETTALFSSCSLLVAYSSTLKMEAICSSRTSVDLQRTKKLNSVALIGKRTISTERPPLVCEFTVLTPEVTLISGVQAPANFV
jgi:hypothetical protein